MTKKNIYIFIDNTYALNITFTNLPTTITKMYFTVKENYDSNVILQKTLDSGITVSNNVYTVTINPSDTELFEMNKKYGYDIKIVMENVEKTVVQGIFSIENTYTKQADEV